MMQTAHRPDATGASAPEQSRWAVPIRWPALRPGEVHVWRVPLDLPPGGSADLHALLDPAERARMRQLQEQADRDQYAASHAALRLILARAVGGPADAIAYRRGPHGKPALANPRHAEVSFSLSHSRALALCAVRLGQPVGVDIEWVRPGLELGLIAEQLFSASERAELCDAGEGQRERAFFRCWTRKEAYLKGRGVGLTGDPRGFSVSLSADACVLDGEPGGWALRDLDADPRYAAAIASPGVGWELRRWGWDWGAC